MNRRGFIKGLTAFAVLAAAPFSPPSEAARQRASFLAAAKDGLVEGQTFYLDGPVIFQEINNLTIRNCKFVINTLETYTGPIARMEGCNHLWLIDCNFECVIHTDCSNWIPVKGAILR